MEHIVLRIIEILVESEAVLTKIITFAELLGSPVTEIIILKREIRNSTIDHSEGLKQLLDGWISREGRKTVADLVKVLERMKCLNVAEILRKGFTLTASLSNVTSPKNRNGRKPNKIWNVIEPIPTFVGRTEEIQKLSAFLQSERERVLVISGMGGQGKTQLCRKWIQDLRKNENCPAILWLSGESCQALMSSLSKFLEDTVPFFDALGVTDFNQIVNQIPTDDVDDISLWVIDNIDSEYEEIKSLTASLTAKTGIAKIVITSRLRTILSKSAEYLTLQTLSPEAAQQLVKQSFKPTPNEEEVGELCHEMGNHALAIQLSIGFIKYNQTCSARGSGFRITDFLKKLKNDKLPLFMEKEELSGYDKPIPHHIKLSMELLKEKNMNLTLEVMKILSLLRFDGVDFGFLVELVATTVDEFQNCDKKEEVMLKVEAALTTLHSFSLVFAELPVVRIHPLIQETIQILFPEWKAVASSILNQTKIRNLSLTDLQQILQLWEIISKEDALLREHSVLVEHIFYRLLETSQLQLLLPFTDSHRNNVLRLFGNDSEREVLRGELYYGRALLEAGEYSEGLTHLELLHSKSSNVLGHVDPLTLQIGAGMAIALVKIYRTDEAVTVYRGLLPLYILMYGKETEETVRIKGNFALALLDSNKCKEALHQYEEVLRWYEENMGKHHPHTLTFRHNIACCQLKQGNIHQAKDEFQTLVELERNLLGEKHFLTLRSRALLAEVIGHMGEWENTKAEYEILINGGTEIFGPTHPQTLTFRHDYAFCLFEVGKKETALRELEEVIELRVKVLGSNHPDVVDSKALLQSKK